MNTQELVTSKHSADRMLCVSIAVRQALLSISNPIAHRHERFTKFMNRAGLFGLSQGQD